MYVIAKFDYWKATKVWFSISRSKFADIDKCPLRDLCTFFNVLNEFEIRISENGEVDFDRVQQFVLQTSALSGVSFLSPSGYWRGDPDTKLITIAPKGNQGWDYLRLWNDGWLDFFDPQFRLRIPPTASVTDSVWALETVPIGTLDSQAMIAKWRLFWRENGGRFVVVFESVNGEISQGGTRGVNVGLPQISITKYGEVLFRSHGNARYYEELGSHQVSTGNTTERCPICFGNYEHDDEVAETRCGHRCLGQVVGRNCPYCRGPFDFV
jgi:hypothetical protein